MSFAAGLATRHFAVALEVTPPQRPLPSVLLRRARLLGGYAGAIDVIQRPDRQSSLDACRTLVHAGLAPVWHLVNRGRTRAAILADLATAATDGITQVLCVRGDHRAADGSDTPPIREVIALARERLPNALIGATLNQYTPDGRAVLRNLLPKLAAGAGYVQTQPVFDLERLRPFAEAVRAASPATKIVPMAIPLLSVAPAAQLAARLGITLPHRVYEDLQQGGAAAGWPAFDETLASLVASPLVDGVAIMTFELDPAPEVGYRIVAALRAAGIGERRD